jgi:hypothetical protein
MSRRTGWAAVVATAAVSILGLSLAAGMWVASADDGPQPTPGPAGFAVCGDQLIPLDPRGSIENPLGALIYERLLPSFCPPPAAGQQPPQPTNLDDALNQVAGAPVFGLVP